MTNGRFIQHDDGEEWTERKKFVCPSCKKRVNMDVLCTRHTDGSQSVLCPYCGEESPDEPESVG